MSDSPINENEVIQKAINGDREAFNDLVHLYSQQIFSLSYRLTNNFVDAEDLSQNVFVKVLIKLPDFKFKSSFSTWIYRITVNNWYDTLRKRNKLKYRTLDFTAGNAAEEHTVNEIIDSAPGIEAKSESKEMNQMLTKAIDSLVPEQKIAIILKYMQDKSLEEICEICDCSIGTLSSRLTRGVKEVKKHIEKYVNTGKAVSE
ncbi:MAG: hypothetical protein A2293_10080 [Elusimicrobia bacterium RIFOXYB2_FULL_49_7]|nr:MAG: hypothetical protein A2293_10080 [Elusimicrobia bacterium RIFOXYB2_FULL_49_7]